MSKRMSATRRKVKTTAPPMPGWTREVSKALGDGIGVAVPKAIRCTSANTGFP